MIKVGAEGTSFYYCLSGSYNDVDSALFHGRHGFTPRELSRVLANPYVRLVTFENILPPRQQIPYYMAWVGDFPDSCLDDKVASGSYNDADFRASIRTRYQVTFCGACKSAYAALVVDTADIYPGNHQLLREKLDRLTFPSALCPNCKQSLRQWVARYL